MIRFLIGLTLVICATGAIDTPVGMEAQETNWFLFTVLLTLGMPCMMWGVLAMSGRE